VAVAHLVKAEGRNTVGKIVVFYGSTTGNTGTAGEQIAKHLGDGVEVRDVRGVSRSAFEEADVLILGTSTWGVGDLQDDWIDAIDELKNASLAGKSVAIFGLGDQEGYPDSFVDGMRDLYDAAVNAGATVVGVCTTDGYDFGDSRAVIDGKLIGLAIDEDNQSDLTQARIENWVNQLRNELGMS
jgi:flavodoxin I